MIFVKHRVNSIADLKKTNAEFGVEIDLRSENKKIYLHHDPFKKGETFEKWIKQFRHKCYQSYHFCIYPPVRHTNDFHHSFLHLLPIRSLN